MVNISQQITYAQLIFYHILHPFSPVVMGRKFSYIASLPGLIRTNDAEVKTLHNTVADHYNS